MNGKIKRNDKILRVPVEFDDKLNIWANDLKRQTGLHYSKIGVCRLLSSRESKIVIKRGKIDWKLF